MARRMVDELVPNDKGMGEGGPPRASAAMQSVITELRAIQVPCRPNVSKRTFSFESLFSFLQAVRQLSRSCATTRLEIVDEGVSDSHQLSLYYTTNVGAEKLYLRITDDPARHALKRGAGLFASVNMVKRGPGSRVIGWAIFDASRPINPVAVNRVLHGLPAEAAVAEES
jgi:hypothetical protein